MVINFPICVGSWVPLSCIAMHFGIAGSQVAWQTFGDSKGKITTYKKESCNRILILLQKQ